MSWWATTWGEDANACLAPWPDPDEEQEAHGLHWKTHPLVSSDLAWVAAHHPERALLYRVDPQVGLVERDFTALAHWLTGP